MAIEWRGGAAYGPLLEADRSLFAWEWLRRDPAYRAAAERSLSDVGDCRRAEAAAAAFGLVRFEPPDRAVPFARPLWRSEANPQVLAAGQGDGGGAGDLFALERWRDLATLVAGDEREHLLLSDGLRTVRLDGPPRLLSGGPACLRYRIEGLAGAQPRLVALQRFLSLCRTGRFARTLHPREPRARRWVLMLRVWDGLAQGASQREIAEFLLDRAVRQPHWRARQPSIRLQAQRLVRGARGFGEGGWRRLLTG